MAESTVPSPAATPGPARAVGPLELFFDLVFVFAVSHLSDHLLTHLNWRGAGETAVLRITGRSERQQPNQSRASQQRRIGRVIKPGSLPSSRITWDTRAIVAQFFEEGMAR